MARMDWKSSHRTRIGQLSVSTFANLMPMAIHPSIYWVASTYPTRSRFACLVAFCLHRGGIVVGTLGGAIFGLALYCINFYTLTVPELYPWFFAMRSWVFVVTHVVFGALVGLIYEALEVEEFMPVEETTP